MVNKSNIDYRLLLIKYIDHVGYHEGISYIGDKYGSDVFSPEEWEELKYLNLVGPTVLKTLESLTSCLPKI